MKICTPEIAAPSGRKSQKIAGEFSGGDIGSNGDVLPHFSSFSASPRHPPWVYGQIGRKGDSLLRKTEPLACGIRLTHHLCLALRHLS